MNSTITDIFGGLLACSLFFLVFIPPGYFLGWALNIFEFKKLPKMVVHFFAIILSNAVLPIIIYLSYKYISGGFTIAIILALGMAYIAIQIYSFFQNHNNGSVARIEQERKYESWLLTFIGIWVVFSIILIVDLQIGDHLYFTTVSYDYSTRIAVVDAISRTGVPPINPGYYPNHPVQLTYLYYYWYILVSIVDQLGGTLVNARQAMTAGASWAGISLMAMITVYLHFRSDDEDNSLALPLIGTRLLLVSGLDFIPVILLFILGRYILGMSIFNGRIEGWNMPIMSWLHALTWVPNHVSAAISCLTAMVLFLVVLDRNHKQKLMASILSGLSFASALGTSVWITLTFAVAWIIWAAIFAARRADKYLFWSMVLSGAIGTLLSIPFIAGLITEGNTGGSHIIELYVRPFYILNGLFNELPGVLPNLLNMLFLPASYLMELGFFFVVGIHWLTNYRKLNLQKQHYYLAEAILLGVVIVLLSFFRSSIIFINDWGIRGWLLGQFVLLIWSTDLIKPWSSRAGTGIASIFKILPAIFRRGNIARSFLIIGIMTTFLEAVATRTWPMLVDLNVAGFPNDLSPDTNLGKRTYYGKLAYEFIDQRIGHEIVIQNNPYSVQDRPSGLYSTAQMAISDRTDYGIPSSIFLSMQNNIGAIFEQNYSNWEGIDQICKRYSIDVIVVNDTDQLWKSLQTLRTLRLPLYGNPYYEVFACGNYLSSH
jgi:hypothetical protein